MVSYLGSLRAWMTDMEGIPAGKGAEAKQLQLSVSCSLGKCV